MTLSFCWLDDPSRIVDRGWNNCNKRNPKIFSSVLKSPWMAKSSKVASVHAGDNIHSQIIKPRTGSTLKLFLYILLSLSHFFVIVPSTPRQHMDIRCTLPVEEMEVLILSQGTKASFTRTHLHKLDILRSL